MDRIERRGDYILSWKEPAEEIPPARHEWSVEVTTDYPRLLAKLGKRPRRFTAETCECALAEAREFVDSLTLN